MQPESETPQENVPQPAAEPTQTTSQPDDAPVVQPQTPVTPVAPSTPVNPTVAQNPIITAQAPPSIPSPGPVTQADFLALAKKDKKPKRLIIAVLSVLVLVGVGYTVYALGLLPFGGLKTIKFDNGKGSKYSLKFYSKYEVGQMNQGAGGADAEHVQALISKVSKEGKAPIELTIFDSKANVAGNSDYYKDCAGDNPAFTAHNNYANTDVNVCNLSSGAKDVTDYVYVAIFKAKDRQYGLLILQDVDYTSIGGSPEKARALLKTVGMQPYQDDLKQIIASIKPE